MGLAEAGPRPRTEEEEEPTAAARGAARGTGDEAVLHRRDVNRHANGASARFLRGWL